MAKVGCPYPRVSRLAQHSANTSQPGSANAFKPINTIAGVQGTNPNHGKGRTYGKIDRNAARISEREALFPGSQSYRRQQLAQKTGNVSEYGVVQTSPAKRRKTENPNTTASSPVEILDDEDEEVWSARRTSTPQARSIVSSGSPRSTISKHSATGPKTASQATSEFANTDELLDSRRHRPRPRRPRSKGPSEHRKMSPAGVPFLGAGTQPQGQAFVIHDDSESSPKTARSLILQEYKQGVTHEQAPKMQRSTGLKSNHFGNGSKMCVDESTAKESVEEQHSRSITERTGSNGLSYYLRNFRHAEHVDDPISSSGDEIAPTNLDTSKAGRGQSLAAARRKIDTLQQSDVTGISYGLRYARSYNLNVSSKDLRLRQVTPHSKTFRITTLDSEGNVQTLDSVDLSRVNRSEFDNLNRIRLLGSNTNGNRYWFDLQFAEDAKFRNFRDNLVAPECLQSLVYTK